MKIILFFGCLLLIMLESCTDYDRENFRMEVGKKYALEKFPDSAYIDTLDRFFAKEPVKRQQKQKIEMTMNMNNAMNLPKIGKSAPKENVSKSGTNTSNAIKPNEGKAKESFADNFFYALTKLIENPNSKEFGKKYKAKENETLDDLLIRIYGSKVKQVPKFVSESMLKQLNPNADFSSLSEGENILLPSI